MSPRLQHKNYHQPHQHLQKQLQTQSLTRPKSKLNLKKQPKLNQNDQILQIHFHLEHPPTLYRLYRHFPQHNLFMVLHCKSSYHYWAPLYILHLIKRYSSGLKRPCVISSMENHARFSASYLANPAPKTDGIPRNKKLLCKANSDSQALYFKNNGLLSPDRDSQLIGVTSEHHLGPQCVIRRKINFESDDAFIKTFQLYWYVDASKGCLESPILSNSNKRIHGSSPIETPYFVITKNQRRHQAYRNSSKGIAIRILPSS